MKQFFSRFWSHQRGIAFIEFAIVFPFMFLLLFGGVEVARYILITQKVEKAAYVLTDIIGQSTPAAYPQVQGELRVETLQNTIFPQFHRMLGSFGNTAREGIIVSSVINTPNNGLKLRWQQAQLGNDVAASRSVVDGQARNTSGDTCFAAPFNAEVNTLLGTMTKGENMIVGEVFYFYKPLVSALLGVTSATPAYTGGGFSLKPQVISRRLYLHPRNGELVDLPPAHEVNPNKKPCQ